MSEPNYPLTIFYDASCPLCASELHALRDHDERRSLVLVDCSAEEFADASTKAAGISRADLMQCIHARDATGRWYRGVDVLALAYRTAGIESIARLWAHPRLRPLWSRVYPWIARHRMTLSRLRLHGLFGWLIRRAARRAGPKNARHSAS